MTRRLSSTFGSSTAVSEASAWASATQLDRLKILRAYYDSDDLYQTVETAMEKKAKTKDQLVALRNPTRSVVEFHVDHLWAGPLKNSLRLESESELLEAQQAALDKVFKWSEWGTKKQVAARWLSRDGNLFIKIVENDDSDQVSWQMIDAANVVDFDVDERGFIKWIRLDIPLQRRVDSKLEDYMFTEVWDKETLTHTTWEHDKPRGEDLDKLPTNNMNEIPFSDYDVDFVPFVLGKFKDDGKKWGAAAIQGVLDKVDEANRQGTRLHRQVFRLDGVVWAVKSNMTTPSGAPIPPPAPKSSQTDADGEIYIEIGDERAIMLPGNSDLVATTPDLHYAEHLEIIKDHELAMERDLPELTYHRIKETEASGVALRVKLGDAISRVEEARANAYSSLVRAAQMALTIGQLAGLPGFLPGDIGTWDNDDFDFDFKETDVIPVTKQERAETLKTLTDAGMPLFTAMRESGFTDAEIEEARAERETDRNFAASQFAQASVQAMSELQAQRDARTGTSDTTVVENNGTNGSQPVIGQPAQQTA